MRAPWMPAFLRVPCSRPVDMRVPWACRGGLLPGSTPKESLAGHRYTLEGPQLVVPVRVPGLLSLRWFLGWLLGGFLHGSAPDPEGSLRRGPWRLHSAGSRLIGLLVSYTYNVITSVVSCWGSLPGCTCEGSLACCTLGDGLAGCSQEGPLAGSAPERSVTGLPPAGSLPGVPVTREG